MSNFVIGIDVGTTGLKALSVSETGTVLHSVTIPYEPEHPKVGWSQQDPFVWRDAVVSALKEIKQLHDAGRTAEKETFWPPDAVGFSGQMHGSVFLDKNGEPLTSAILWNDQRTWKECREIEELTDGHIEEWTLNPPRTAFTATKILWTRTHMPHIWEQTRKLLLPKDYVRYVLSETIAADVTDASGTNLFDVKERKWSDRTLEALDIPADIMPPVFESCEQAGIAGGKFAREAGLPDGTPLVAGAADQAAAALGMGVVKPGDLSVTLGTSGVVYLQTAEPVVEKDGALHTFCHAVPGTYQMMGGVLSAAGSAAWLNKIINQYLKFTRTELSDFTYQQMMDLAEQAPAGANGLLFLPYLTGERSPHNDPRARGSWFGLTSQHNAADLTRSVLEGVAFALNDLLRICIDLGVEPKSIRIGGGGSRGLTWLKIIASVFNMNIAPVKATDASAMGAAVLAASAAYNISPDNVAESWIEEEGIITSDNNDSKLYSALYKHFRSLYPVTAAEMHKLADFISSIEDEI